MAVKSGFKRFYKRGYETQAESLPKKVTVGLGETWFITMKNSTVVHQVTFQSVRKEITMLKYRSNGSKCKWILDSEIRLLEKV